jgi:putative transposase
MLRVMKKRTEASATALWRVLKRLHFLLEAMLACVRWYVAYPSSLRHVEEMMAEHGISVDHSTVHRWALKILPVLDAAFRQRKRVLAQRWRMDETYVKINGQWKNLHRAVDQGGETVDFLLTARRDTAVVRRFLAKAMAQQHPGHRQRGGSDARHVSSACLSMP